METIIRNIRDLASADRSALERIVGHKLLETQQLVLNLVNPDIDRAIQAPDEAKGSEVPNWWKIYEGLSDEEVDKLDAAIRERATLTRFSSEADLLKPLLR